MLKPSGRRIVGGAERLTALPVRLVVISSVEVVSIDAGIKLDMTGLSRSWWKREIINVFGQFQIRGSLYRGEE